MQQFLDWFRLEEVFSIVVLTMLLTHIGGKMMTADSETYQRARRLTAAVLLLYSGLAIWTWGVSSVTDLLIITLRASLAAGVTFGLALVLLTPAAFLIGRLKALKPKAKQKSAEPLKSPLQPESEPRDYAAEAKAEAERMSKVEDARTLTSQFYDEHAELLEEVLPVALFKSQIQTRFPAAIPPDEAWRAAQSLITEMIPLIAKAREQKRSEQEEERKRAEETEAAEHKRREEIEAKDGVKRLTEWYQTEKERLETSLPEGVDRVNLLNELFDRFDQLLKQTLRDMKP